MKKKPGRPPKPESEKKPRRKPTGKPREKRTGNFNPYTNGTKSKEDIIREDMERLDKRMAKKKVERAEPEKIAETLVVDASKEKTPVEIQIDTLLAHSGPLVLEGEQVPLTLRMLSLAAKTGGRKDTLETMYLLAKPTLDKVFQFIALGSSDHVAAESLGITYETFKRWMRIGEEQVKKYQDGEEIKSISVHVWFYLNVMENKAKARLTVEAEVRAGDLKSKQFWLQNMARTKGDREGWDGATITVQGNPEKPIEHEHNHTGSVKVTPAQTQDLAQALMLLDELGLITLDDQTVEGVIEESDANSNTPSLPEKNG